VRGSASFQRGGVYAGRAVEAVGLVLGVDLEQVAESVVGRLVVSESDQHVAAHGYDVSAAVASAELLADDALQV
jgi:hypothetical protein